MMLMATLAPPIKAMGFDKRDIAASLPGGWSYSGCWTDTVQDRKLNSDTYTDSTGMCEGSCIDYCSAKGYTFAGVEYGRECYCGYGLRSGSTKDVESACNMVCPGGGADETCGGPNHLSVFTNGGAGGSNKANVNGFSYVSCYTDSASARVLTHVAHNDQTSKNMTVEFCTSTCAAAGFVYAGVEFGGECYCDNQLASGAASVSGNPVDSGCDIECNGDSTEWCGGNGRLSL
jgi:hypothetical protein